MTFPKPLIAATMIAAVGAGAAVPAISSAATTTNVKQTSSYQINVNRGVLAGGGRTVKATAVVTNPERSVSDWYSRATIQQVVRKAANQGIQKFWTV